MVLESLLRNDFLSAEEVGDREEVGDDEDDDRSVKAPLESTSGVGDAMVTDSTVDAVAAAASMSGLW